MSLYKRGDIWHTKIMCNGQMHYSSCFTTSKTEARKFEHEYRERLTKPREPTLNDIAQYWMDNIAPKQKDYRNSMLNLRHIAPFIDGVRVSESAAAARAISSAWPKLATATVNRRLALLRRLVGIGKDAFGCNECPSIKLLSGERKRDIYLNKSQVVRLAKASKGSKWHIIFLAFTGMRVSEALNCRVVGNLAYIDDSKSNKPRVIPLNKPAQCAYSRLKQGRAYRTIQGDFKAATRALGMEGVRLHDLRHTCASFLVKANVNLTVIRDILGHSSLSVTSRYSHLEVGQMAEALNKI